MATKVGIDFGAGRVKYSYKIYENSNVIDRVFPNRYIVGNNNSNGVEVVRDDYIVKIGCTGGVNNLENVKTNYKYLDDIILVVAQNIKDNVKSIEDTVELNISTVLPPAQYLTVADAFKAKIMGYETYSGVVNGKKITTKIANVTVGCEAVAILNAMDIDKVCELDRCLLADVGSSTIDFVNLERDGDAWEIIDANTVNNVGGALIVQDITDYLKNKYPTMEFVADEIESKMFYYIGTEKHQVIDDVNAAKHRIEILDKAFRRYYKGGEVIIGGGAGKLLASSEAFKALLPAGVKPIMLSDELRTFGNSRGALYS